MTIRRQYSLPNCTLFLEGLSDATTGNGQSEMRPIMSILVNAECHLAGGKPTISGGREFFESLVKAVSRYAQGFLSGIQHPDEDGQAFPPVQVRQIERGLHRLIVQNQGDAAVLSNGATGLKATTPIQIDLTTVQLFDLVEAVDQFFADSQTLPDMSVSLAPISRRYAKPDEPIAKRAAPAALGLSSLALAAIAFFLVPVPEVQKPQDTRPQPNSNSLSPSPNPTNDANTGEPPLSPTPTTGALLSPSPTPLETPLATPQGSPTATFNPGATPLVSPSPTTSPLTTGSLISPSPTPLETPPGTALTSPTPTLPATPLVSPTPLETPATPLASPTPTLPATSLASPTPTLPATSLASPTPTNSPLASQESEITDSSKLRELNTNLYNTIQQNVQGRLRFPDKLEYRVGVRADGTVVEYEARNQAAIDYANQTPLPKLKSSSTSVAPATPSSEPVGYYRVVFTRRGVLQVSPWRGY